MRTKEELLLRIAEAKLAANSQVLAAERARDGAIEAAASGRALVSILDLLAADVVFEPPVVVPPPPPPPPLPALNQMRAFGRQIRDARNVAFLARGAELIIGGDRGPAAGAANGITDVIASTGCNAFWPNKFFGLTDQQVLNIHTRSAAVGMVPYVTPPEAIGLDWFSRPLVKSTLGAMPNIVIDVLLEQEGGNNAASIANWLAAAKFAITKVRGFGYTKQLLQVHSIQQGRNLRQLLVHGQELLDFDPSHNLLFGCQMYWPSPPAWQWADEQGFGTGLAGVRQAFVEIAAAPFAIQLGFAPSDEADRPSPYANMLALAAEFSVPWLWWDWTGVGGDDKHSLTTEGTLATKTTAGSVVIDTHAGGFKTAKRASW